MGHRNGKVGGMGGQGTARGHLAPVLSPACEEGDISADVDEMWSAIGAVAALIGLSGSGQDLLTGVLAESVAANTVLADGVMGGLALLESENAAHSANEARRIYGGTLRWRNSDDYDRSGDAAHMLDAAKQVAAHLGGGAGAGEAAVNILNDWRRAT